MNQLLSERDHGKATFAVVVDEPATVTVNGKPAKVMSTDGGAPYRFEAVIDLDAGAEGGASTVVVQAKDGQNNTATKTYEVATTGTSKTFEYDANGNLRYEKQPNGTVIREYRWDQQNRLVRFLQGTHESVYEYDGESRRVRIKELTSSTETKNETFVWCGARICQKRASNGTTVVRNYFEEGFEASGPTDYFYARDRLGSVREVVASEGTTIASRLSYGPWGAVTESGSGALSDFGFTGHYFDRPSGLALTWFRGYDTSLGRWISSDPIGLDGGWNLYGYVDNDPVDLIDPLVLKEANPDGEKCDLNHPKPLKPRCMEMCIAKCRNDKEGRKSCKAGGTDIASCASIYNDGMCRQLCRSVRKSERRHWSGRRGLCTSPQRLRHRRGSRET